MHYTIIIFLDKYILIKVFISKAFIKPDLILNIYNIRKYLRQFSEEVAKECKIFEGLKYVHDIGILLNEIRQQYSVESFFNEVLMQIKI